MVTFTGAVNYSTSDDLATCTDTSSTVDYPNNINRIFITNGQTITDYVRYYINSTLMYTSTVINSGTFYPACHNDMADAECEFIPSSGAFSWDIKNTADEWTDPGNTENYVSACNTDTTGQQVYLPAFFQIRPTATAIEIRETTTGTFNLVHTQSHTMQDGDVLKVEFSGTPSTSDTLLPPPVAWI